MGDDVHQDFYLACTPLEFGEVVREIQKEPSVEPNYVIGHEDKYMLEVLFGHFKSNSMGVWVGDLGSATVLTTGDPSISHLDMYIHDSVQKQVEPFWQLLLDALTERQLISASCR